MQWWLKQAMCICLEVQPFHAMSWSGISGRNVFSDFFDRSVFMSYPATAKTDLAEKRIKTLLTRENLK
jgi:hypothetical protein